MGEREREVEVMHAPSGDVRYVKACQVSGKRCHLNSLLITVRKGENMDVWFLTFNAQSTMWRLFRGDIYLGIKLRKACFDSYVIHFNPAGWVSDANECY